MNEGLSWLMFVLSALSGLATAVIVDRHLHHGYSDGTTSVLALAASGGLMFVLLVLRIRSGKPLHFRSAVVAGLMPALILCILQLVV